MAVLDGYSGQLYVDTGGGLAVLLNVTKWRGKFAQQMVNVTPKNSSAAVYMPSHSESQIFLEGFIDEAYSQEVFSMRGSVTPLQLRPNAVTATKHVQLNVLVEDIEWIVGIDEPNRFTAICRGVSVPVLTWS